MHQEQDSLGTLLEFGARYGLTFSPAQQLLLRNPSDGLDLSVSAKQMLDMRTTLAKILELPVEDDSLSDIVFDISTMQIVAGDFMREILDGPDPSTYEPHTYDPQGHGYGIYQENGHEQYPYRRSPDEKPTDGYLQDPPQVGPRDFHRVDDGSGDTPRLFDVIQNDEDVGEDSEMEIEVVSVTQEQEVKTERPSETQVDEKSGSRTSVTQKFLVAASLFVAILAVAVLYLDVLG